MLALATVLIAMVAFMGSAAAEYRASRATFSAINRLLAPSARTLDDHLVSVEVSSVGPFALAAEGGGQGYRELLKHSRGRWLNVAVVSLATGLKCNVAPTAVIHDLHLLRYTSGHRCYGPR